jgi:hypothetical protein
MPEELLSREYAARFVRERYKMRCQPGTLAVYAVYGQGPKFEKRGLNVYYSTADLVEWCESRITARSARASDLREKQAA